MLGVTIKAKSYKSLQTARALAKAKKHIKYAD
jgi:hypothetical protein